jgi:deoxyxylulose-5-phosphate synthase
MHALSAHAWDYLPALKTVFESVGLDYLYHINGGKSVHLIKNYLAESFIW